MTREPITKSPILYSVALLLLLGNIGLAQSAPPVRVVGLAVDALSRPLGLDNPAPRLTWRFESNRNGVMQTRYRLFVATRSQTAADGKGAGLVWDSGPVASADPFALYAGPPLKSRTRYYWTVRAATGTSVTYRAQTAWFETAYLRPGEWKGSWISGPNRSGDAADWPRPSGTRENPDGPRAVRPVPLLRKAFTVAPLAAHGRIVAARLYSAGLAYNNMTLNGADVSHRRLDPGFTNYSKTVLYTTDDITRLIRQQLHTPAPNVIAAQLGSGQFDEETTSNNWHWEDAEWRSIPRLRADLCLRYADGTEQWVGSDSTWKVSAAGPTRYDGYYLGETYDARKALPGWDTPGYNAAAWDAARIVSGPRGILRAERENPTQVVATWPAGKRTSPRPGVVVYDTGRQRAGWATIRVYGARRGTAIQIFYSDKTAPDGTVSASGYTPNGQVQTDYYIADGTGTAQHPERFTPRFTYKGFQYIQISAPSHPAGTDGGTPQPLPPGVTVGVESVQEVRTAMRPTGTFHAGNPLLERIAQHVRAAIAENYVGGIITDTPEYEKNAWTGDAALSAPTASLLFDTESQYRKSLQDMADNQVSETGEVTLLAPTNAGYGHVGQSFKNAANAGATPVWDAFWFVIPWESYLRYGDRRVLGASYPLMRKYLDKWVPRWTGKDGDAFPYTLTSGLGDWDPPSGADAPLGSAPQDAPPKLIAPTSTAYYAYLAQIASNTARALGKPKEAAHYAQLFAHIKHDFNARWWDAGAGFYRETPQQGFTQTLQILPLAFGLVPSDRRAGLQAKLIEDITLTRDNHEMVGIAGARWILPVLSQAADEGVAGAADAAYAVAAQTTYPSYGYWDKLGWTALGERWEHASRTRSHHMYASIGQWFYENLAGIRPLAPGYRQILFDPTIPAALAHAEATYDSVRGPIACSWRQSGPTLTVTVTVPPNATGIVSLPTTDVQAVAVSNSRNVRFIKQQGARLLYHVASGRTRFTVRVVSQD